MQPLATLLKQTSTRMADHAACSGMHFPLHMRCGRCGRIEADSRDTWRWRISLATGETVCPLCTTTSDVGPRWRHPAELTEDDCRELARACQAMRRLPPWSAWTA